MEQRQIHPAEDKIYIVDYLIVLLKRKMMILIITFAAVVITAIISLNMTEIYKAETKILPPQPRRAGVSASLLSQFGGAAAIAGNILGISGPNALYVGMLNSRSIMDRIVNRFDLMRVYNVKRFMDARNRLSDSVKVNSNVKSRIITISVEDMDPEMAADIANALVEELRNLTRNIAITEAAQRRVFFENHLEKAKELLAMAEEKMARFKAETGALKIDEQAKAVITAISKIKAQIVEKEVQLQVMRTYSTSNNPDLQRVEESLKGFRAELGKLETGQGKQYDPLMSTEKMPEIATEYIRILRDLKFRETLYDLFLNQYEAARLDEARDAVIVQVIDKAIPPEIRTRPKRTRMVIIAAFGGFVFAIFMAFLLEYRESLMDDPQSREKLEMLKKYATIRVKK